MGKGWGHWGLKLGVVLVSGAHTHSSPHARAPAGQQGLGRRDPGPAQPCRPALAAAWGAREGREEREQWGGGGGADAEWGVGKEHIPWPGCSGKKQTRRNSWLPWASGLRLESAHAADLSPRDCLDKVALGRRS